MWAPASVVVDKDHNLQSHHCFQICTPCRVLGDKSIQGLESLDIDSRKACSRLFPGTAWLRRRLVPAHNHHHTEEASHTLVNKYPPDDHHSTAQHRILPLRNCRPRSRSAPPPPQLCQPPGSQYGWCCCCRFHHNKRPRWYREGNTS